MSDKAKSTTALILVLTAWSGLAWAAPQEWSGRGAPPPKVSVPGLSAPAWAGQESRNRIAIVIGNGSGYAERKLAKPEQDASSMAAMLKGLGFRVYGLVNASREEMDRLVREVTEDAKDQGEVEVIFYYSGHGSQIANANYLLPVDLPADGDDVTIVNRAYALSEVLGRLSQLKGRKVVLLDACRNNPYAKGKGAGTGLAKVGGGPETLVAYATQPGLIASEGSSRFSHSLFTEALLKALADPNRNVTEVLASTITMVHGESEERQLPDFTSNLGENGFYFAPRKCSPGKERQLWSQARAADTEAAYQDFLQTCQGSDKAADASYAIGKLREKRDMQSRLNAQQQERKAILPPSTPEPTTTEPQPMPRNLAPTLDRIALHPDVWIEPGQLSLSYDVGQSTIPAAALPPLRKLAQTLPKDKDLKIMVMAYAASSELEETVSKDRRMSLSRGLQIRKYLIDAGFTPTIFEIKAMGRNSAPGTAPNRVDITAADDDTKRKWPQLNVVSQDKPASIAACANCPDDMVTIPAGSAMLGSDDTERAWAADNGFPLKNSSDETPRKVTIAHPFALARTPVTRGQWARFAEATGYQGKECGFVLGAEWKVIADNNWLSPGFNQTDDHPVVCVSWHDAWAYIRWLNRQTSGTDTRPYRLPSESEWEYAARANNTLWAPWGNGEGNPCEHANVNNAMWDGKPTNKCDDGFEQTAPVNHARFLNNGYGISQILGNIYNLTSDCYKSTVSNSDGRPVDGPSDCARVAKGTTYLSSKGSGRFAFRGYYDAERRISILGFRLAMDLDNPTISTVTIKTPTRVRLTATYVDCWIRVRNSNGPDILSTVLHTGEGYDVPNTSGLTLWIGNSCTLGVLVDGQPVPSVTPQVGHDISLDPKSLRSGG